MTRAHIADPDLIRNALDGQEQNTRPCVSCNYCIEQIGRHRTLTCMMNPTVGREEEWTPLPEPTHRPLAVLVVGGGPAGMECARVAALRGHQVELWERATSLGGQVRIGRRGHGRNELDLLRAYEERQLKAHGVRIRTGREATVESVTELQPDAVIIAAGSRHTPASLPGWGPTTTVAQALARPEWTGEVALVLDETGGWTPLSVAESLSERGAIVHLVTAASTPLWSVPEYSRMVAVERLQAKAVEIHPACHADVDDDIVHLRSHLNSHSVTVRGVTDIVAVQHPQATDSLAEPLREKGINTILIGDAMAPRSLLEAMFEGHFAGRNL